jgi:hypothetical protein
VAPVYRLANFEDRQVDPIDGHTAVHERDVAVIAG